MTPSQLSTSEMSTHGASYYNTSTMSRVERWLQLTARPHSVRGKSKYRGVASSNSHPDRPWRATLRFQGRTYYGGQFATQEEAALAWNDLVIRHIGPEAKPRLNKVPGTIHA